MNKKKIIQWIALVSVFFLCLTMAVMAYMLGSERGTQWLVKIALPYADEYAGQKITMVDFKGEIADKISIQKLIVEDKKGIWLEVDAFEFDWQWTQLLKGKIWVEALRADKIALLRQPIFPEVQNIKVQKASDEKKELNLSSLNKIKVDALELKEVIIGEEITYDVPLNYHLIGQWDLMQMNTSFLSLTEKGSERPLIHLATKGTIDLQNMALDVEISALPTQTLYLANIYIIPGEINGVIHVQGNASYPEMRGEITLNAQAKTEEENIPIALNITAETDMGILNTQVKIVMGEQESGKINAYIPFLSREEKGSIIADIDLSALQQLFQEKEHEIAGVLKADIRLENGFDLARIKGELSLQKGRYFNSLAGANINNITLLVKLEGERVVIEKFTANDGEKGTMQLAGWAEIQANGFATDIELGLDKMLLVQRDDVSAELSSIIRVAGNQKKIDVIGTVTSEMVSVTLPKDMTSDIPSIDVVDKDEMVTQEQVATAKKAKKNEAEDKMQVVMDVTVTAPNRIFVHGNGLEMELAGDVHLGGDVENLVTKGALKTVRGYLELFSRKFVVSEGAVNIDGKDIQLNIKTEADVEDGKVIVAVTGEATKPEIKLSAVPELPQDEIVARILFGKHVKDVTPMQALQLANAVRNLQGGFGGGGFDPIAMTRNAIGVDSFTVESDSSGGGKGVKVGAGKYVSEKVYVEVNKSTASEGVSARVEIEVTDKISVESVTRSETQSVGVGVNWKHDY